MIKYCKLSELSYLFHMSHSRPNIITFHKKSVRLLGLTVSGSDPFQQGKYCVSKK